MNDTVLELLEQGEQAAGPKPVGGETAIYSFALELAANRIDEQKRELNLVNALQQDARELINQSEDQLAEQARRIGELEKDKNGAYSERNKLVAALSKLLPSWLERHPESDTEWEDDWRWIVFMLTPADEQMSWHIHDSELERFGHLTREADVDSWDGHTVEVKYERLARLSPPTEAAQQRSSDTAGFISECVAKREAQQSKSTGAPHQEKPADGHDIHFAVDEKEVPLAPQQEEESSVEWTPSKEGDPY